LAAASGGSLTITDPAPVIASPLLPTMSWSSTWTAPATSGLPFHAREFADQAAARAAVEQQGGQVIEEPSDAPIPRASSWW